MILAARESAGHQESPRERDVYGVVTEVVVKKA